ncbi:hypothetical protein [Brachyspira hampsonii]|nr:hypothetical protein [Brachyspira hampsonii]
MYSEYIGYDVVKSYSLKTKNGDTFTIDADVDSNTDFHLKPNSKDRKAK